MQINRPASGGDAQDVEVFVEFGKVVELSRRCVVLWVGGEDEQEEEEGEQGVEAVVVFDEDRGNGGGGAVVADEQGGGLPDGEVNQGLTGHDGWGEVEHCLACCKVGLGVCVCTVEWAWAW